MRKRLLLLIPLLFLACNIEENVVANRPTGTLNAIPLDRDWLDSQESLTPGRVINFDACNRRLIFIATDCWIIMCDVPCLPGDFDCWDFHCEASEPGKDDQYGD